MNIDLEFQLETINYKSTKEYFKEVLISFKSQCYKSSIITLHAVVMTDIISRFLELQYLFDNVYVNNMLGSLNNLKALETHSFYWEKTLIEQAHNFKLIDDNDYKHIQNLILLRNNCIQPLINLDYTLFKPEKEVAESIIQNTIKHLLAKETTLFSVINQFIIDYLKENPHNTDLNILVEQINTEYFSKFPYPILEAVSLNFWRASFSITSTNKQAKKNIYLLLFEFLLDRNETIRFNIFLDNRDSFTIDPKKTQDYSFINLLNRNNFIYENLNEQTKDSLKNLSKDELLLKFNAIFLLDKSNSNWLQKHLNYTLSFHNSLELHEYKHCYKCEYNTFIKFISKTGEFLLEFYPDKQKEIILFISELYANSKHFISTAYVADLIIKHIEKFDINNLKIIVEGTNNNKQIYGKLGTSNTNQKVKTALDKLCTNKPFNYVPYPNFRT